MINMADMAKEISNNSIIMTSLIKRAGSPSDQEARRSYLMVTEDGILFNVLSRMTAVEREEIPEELELVELALEAELIQAEDTL